MAFGRQATNAYILRFKPQLIVSALDSLMAKKKFAKGFTLRLYVDGDFSSVSDFALWQGILSERPTIKAYGYSKSFAEIMAYANSGASFASNYVLNVSGGHNHNADTVKDIEALPITRGSFVAVPIAIRDVQLIMVTLSIGNKSNPLQRQCTTSKRPLLVQDNATLALAPAMLAEA